MTKVTTFSRGGEKKFRIGCHVSASGGYMAMGRRAEAVVGNTFAFFTRNPRGGAAGPVDPADVERFRPFIPETPNDEAGCAAEIELLRELYGGSGSKPLETAGFYDS